MLGTVLPAELSPGQQQLGSNHSNAASPANNGYKAASQRTDLGSIPSTHTAAAHNHLSFQFQRIQCPLSDLRGRHVVYFSSWNEKRHIQEKLEKPYKAIYGVSSVTRD